jgi:glycosyltransferase involved in cell wall biosynthesis
MLNLVIQLYQGMRILNVIASMDPVSGGTSQGIRNIIPALQSIGVDNEVLCFDDPASEFISKDDFVTHAIGPAKGPYAYCEKLNPWLLENLGRFDAVIIQGVWLHNSYGTYSAWKKFKKNNPATPNLFLMTHGMLDPYFQKAKERKVKAIRNWLFWKLFENKVINNIDGILFTCQEELLLARQTFTPYKPARELNVGYGIPMVPQFKPEMKIAFEAKCPEVQNRPYFLFISRVHPKKGVDILIKAYLHLKTAHNLPALVIAGPGIDTPYGEEMLALAGNGNDIFFPGMISGDSKWGAFYGCEAFVLPSHQENFGIAVVEAMACQKPVIISRQVNIWREIDDAKAGVVVNDNEQDVIEGLQKWQSFTQEQKIDLGTNAYNAFEKYFHVDQAAKNLKLAIQQVKNDK